MNNKLFLTAVLLSAILFQVSCRKEGGMNEKQLILFQFDYINNTAGLHNGFLVDSKGNILTYNNPVKWNSDDELTEKQVLENLQSCKPAGTKISEQDLHKYRNLIINIASSKVTAIRNSSSGEGTARFICYQYSENKGSHIGHVIKMEGDQTCENLNFYSKKVTAWLREIGLESGNVMSDYAGR